MQSTKITEEVLKALSDGEPVVALESTLITHGLPYPQNLDIALELEEIVSSEGAHPATIAVLDGELKVGLTAEEIERLAKSTNVKKISIRDLPIALAKKQTGGTTVASSIQIAEAAGIEVFATGGIGGVHREPSNDISADLPALSSTNMLVVCAGAKAILDLPATHEWLETHGVSIVGYQTSEFPAFYSRTSGLPVDSKMGNPDEIAQIWDFHKGLQLDKSIVVAVPVPEQDACDVELIESAIEKSQALAVEQGITGKDWTPFMLKQVAEITEGQSLKANLSLLRNNARVAAKIAKVIIDF